MTRTKHSIFTLVALTRQIGLMDQYSVSASYTSYGDLWNIIIFDAETNDIEYQARVVDSPKEFMQHEKTVDQAYDDVKEYLR